MPDRFYYNLGELFRDMQTDNSLYYDVGKNVGEFYRGIMSIVDNEDIAVDLTAEFIRNMTIETNDKEDE